MEHFQTELKTEHLDAARIATEAGELLLELRQSLEKTDANVKTVQDMGDRSSHEMITQQIARLYPDDALLSEEGIDNTLRLQARRVWIIDPLDGTREFGERGRTDWAVHVALVMNETPVVGAVALPAQGLTLSTAQPPILPARPERPIRLVASRTRAPKMITTLAQQLQAETVLMGSAGAKAMAVVQGEVDIYVHAGGQHEWDSAAPVAVAMAAGLHVSRLDGSPLRYNQPEPYLPDLLICRPELAAETLRLLAQANR